MKVGQKCESGRIDSMSTLNTLRTSAPYFTREESLPQIREVEIGYNTDEMKTIKTGESEFERLIKSDSLYVDKSMYIHLLRMGQSYCFAARPRRYGKFMPSIKKGYMVTSLPKRGR